MFKLKHLILQALLSPALIALAQNNQPADKLIPEQSIALPWIVGFGIFVCTLIAGFKHPGRTHLD